MLSKFGDYLKTTREMNNISIDEISNITKIDKKFIMEMERGNFDFQTPVYIKAFIKSYAKAVNIDPEDTIKKYELALSNKDADIPLKTETQTQEANSSSQEKSKITISDDYVSGTNNNTNVVTEINHEGYSKIGYQKTSYIYIAIAAVFIVVILIFVYYYRADSNPFESKEIVIDKNQPKYEKEVKPTSTNNQYQATNVKSDSLELRIRYNKDCWTRVVPDDKKSATVDFVGKEGDEKVIKGKVGFMVWFGNASATSMTLNNKNIEYDNKRIASIRLNIDSLGNAYEIISAKKSDQNTEKIQNEQSR